MTVAEGISALLKHGLSMSASMGPQLDSCGRRHAGAANRLNTGLLQWGRNLTVAEGDAEATEATEAETLQWGRNLTVAEGLSGINVLSVSIQGFNGAAT